ncbi:hypothetical protein [Patiriisocius marinus]|uniref:hypothetical protein n=1 Tax=Patiriisocius marinus TaxID=1397112 RepID=UPI00232FCF92|nr:hypothetical protein [Patiriisocius marinus]
MENQKYYQKQREAILNDTSRKQLFKKLFELYSNSLPIILVRNDGNIQCCYSDSVELAAENIRDQIIAVDNKIFDKYKDKNPND